MTVHPAQEESPRPVGAAPPGGHFAFLDGLRAIAALSVVALHAGVNVIWPFPQRPPQLFAAFNLWLVSGHRAVPLFIVISGFCLMLPVLRHGRLRDGTLAFYKRRARRILPPYYMAIGFSLALIYTLVGKKTGGTWDIAIPPTRSGILAHLFLVQNWSPFFHPHYADAAIDYTTMARMSAQQLADASQKMIAVLSDLNNINPPMWSIAVECQIYVLFPMLVWLWRRIGPGKTVALTFLSYLFYVPYHTYLNLWMAPHFLALFALGMLGAQIAVGEGARWERLRQRRGWGTAAAALWLFVFYLDVASKGISFFLNPAVDLIAGPAAMCVIVAAARTGPNRLRRLLSYPKLAFFGTFSYSIYLIHDPLLQVLYEYVMPSVGNKYVQYYLLIIPGGALICLTAYGFFWVAERPFLGSRSVMPPRALAVDDLPLLSEKGSTGFSDA